MQRFSSTDQYIATDGLIEAVNASITLEKPLLIKTVPQKQPNSRNKAEHCRVLSL